MNNAALNLEKPTSELVAKYVNQFQEEFRPVDDALNLLFARFPNNNNLSEIIVKIATIDAIYSTNIRKKYTFTEIAKHILDNKIDEDLKNNNLGVVERIAQAGKARVYSFASKYCHFHKQESYPVFDSFVERMLDDYNKIEKFADFNKNGIKSDYSLFFKVLNEFKKKYNLNCTLKELDEFLWLYGKELQKKKLNLPKPSA